DSSPASPASASLVVFDGDRQAPLLPTPTRSAERCSFRAPFEAWITTDGRLQHSPVRVSATDRFLSGTSAGSSDVHVHVHDHHPDPPTDKPVDNARANRGQNPP